MELASQGIVGISCIDTRALTRHLRERGAMRVGISTTETDPDALRERVLASPSMVGANLVGEVTTREPYVVPADGVRRFTVAALDLGIKSMTPRRLAERGVETRVMPGTSTLADVLTVLPDGRFLSETAFIEELIPHVDATYRTIADRTGRAIEGFSMGGFAALRGHRRRADVIRCGGLDAGRGDLAHEVPNAGARWHHVRLVAAVGDDVVRAVLEGKVLAAVVPAELGQRVAAPGVTVVDDGTISDRRGSLNVDDEGNVWVTDGRAAREAELEEAPDAEPRALDSGAQRFSLVHPTETHAGAGRGEPVGFRIVADQERVLRNDAQRVERGVDDARVGLGEAAALRGDDGIEERVDARRPQAAERRLGLVLIQRAFGGLHQRPGVHVLGQAGALARRGVPAALSEPQASAGS